MQDQKRILIVLILLGLASAGTGRAGSVYLAPPNQSGGSDLNAFLEADDFTLAAPVQIGQIAFWSLQGSVADYAGSIAWSINSDASGAPGSSLYSGSASPAGVFTGNSAFGFSEYLYSFSVVAPLNAGTYWLVLHNGPTGSIPSTDFFWEWSNGNSGNSQSQDLSSAGSPWTSNFAELAMQLDAATPEPGSMMLLGAGLLGAGMLRRRTR